MATYKVLQDIEAEDKLFGPFTLKQFIFAGIAIGVGVAMFYTLSSPMPMFLKIPLVAGMLPPFVLFGLLAAPLSKEQPTEIWLLARISFLFRPRKRIWNQDGISELVTINAPKKEVHTYTNGLSQGEVKSRLQALANTVDSRGWAVKNVTTNLFMQPGYLDDTGSDRLVDPMSLPQDVPVTDITAADDILDIDNNPAAERLADMVEQSAASHRDQVVASMQSPQEETQPAPTDYWFMNQAAPAPDMPLPQDFAMFQDQQTVAPGAQDVHPAAEATAEEVALIEQLKQENKGTYERYTAHTKTLQPLHDRDGNLVRQPEPSAQPQEQATIEPVSQQPEVTNQPISPKNAQLAMDNDKNVDVLAREANRAGDDEVVISLR